MVLRSRCRSTAGGKLDCSPWEDLDKTTDACRIATERVQALIEEFGRGDHSAENRDPERGATRHVFRRPDRAASIRSTAFVAASGRVGQRRTRFYFFFRFRHRFVLGGTLTSLLARGAFTFARANLRPRLLNRSYVHRLTANDSAGAALRFSSWMKGDPRT